MEAAHRGGAVRGFAILGQAGYGLAKVDDETTIVRFDGITSWDAAN